MNTITQILQPNTRIIVPYATLQSKQTPQPNTRIIVPYATLQNNTIVYRAWYRACQINYRTDNHNITLYDDDNQRTQHPIVFLSDRYRNQLVAAFELPYNSDNPPAYPFLRVEIIQYRTIQHIDTQGPLFVITELDTPDI